MIALEDQRCKEIGVGGVRERREDTFFGALRLNALNISRRPSLKILRPLRPSNLPFFHHHPFPSPPASPNSLLPPPLHLRASLENILLAPVESPSLRLLSFIRVAACFGFAGVRFTTRHMRNKRASEPSRCESFAGR